MFSKDFFPIPPEVGESMLSGESISGKVVLEPSGGKGDLVNIIYLHGAKEVLGCENDPELKKILQTKCKLVGSDFLKLESHEISHVDYIVMNPPFSADEKHILHAYNIAPAGCRIIALCNLTTVENKYSSSRKQLGELIEQFGSFEKLGECFSTAQRTTNVSVALVRLQKPGSDYNAEFEGFFTEEEEEAQENGIMSYNFIRDLVNRYVGAIKIFDEQLDTAARLNELTASYFFSDKPELALSVSRLTVPVQRNEFKKQMQKAGWKYIFEKLDMQKDATKGLRESINLFVEKQTHIPFTMQNIYRMLEIIVGTREQRMDKALLEVFDKLTVHYHENRMNLEGWKTNSHYLINQKFIMPNVCCQDQRWDKGKSEISLNSSYTESIEDLLKALCYIAGENYSNFISLYSFCRYEFKLIEDGKMIGAENQYSYAETRMRDCKAKGRNVKIQSIVPVYGVWFDWGFFEIKAFKKGTMHFKFKSEDLWSKFNQRIAKIKGYPLYESVKREAPKAAAQPEKKQQARTYSVISSHKVNTTTA